MRACLDFRLRVGSVKINKLPPLKYLRECFWYEPKAGMLYWKRRPRLHFPTERGWKIFTKRCVGKPALNSGERYRHGHLDGQYLAAHRVMWKLQTGQEPPSIIDHEDENKLNNKWRNLREATHAQNCVKRDRRFDGVHKHRNKNRWVAQAGGRGTKRYIGIFDSLEKARRARRRAMRRIYGKFAA